MSTVTSLDIEWPTGGRQQEAWQAPKDEGKRQDDYSGSSGTKLYQDTMSKDSKWEEDAWQMQMWQVSGNQWQQETWRAPQ